MTCTIGKDDFLRSGWVATCSSRVMLNSTSVQFYAARICCCTRSVRTLLPDGFENEQHTSSRPAPTIHQPSSRHMRDMLMVEISGSGIAPKESAMDSTVGPNCNAQSASTIPREFFVYIITAHSNHVDFIVSTISHDLEKRTHLLST